MPEEGCTGLDVAQRLQAVETAIQLAKKALIHDHLDHGQEHLVEPLTARLTDPMGASMRRMTISTDACTPTCPT